MMLCQRGMLIAAPTPMQMEICTLVANAMQLNGVDGALMDRDAALIRVPLVEPVQKNPLPPARRHLAGQGRGGAP